MLANFYSNTVKTINFFKNICLLGIPSTVCLKKSQFPGLEIFVQETYMFLKLLPSHSYSMHAQYQYQPTQISMLSYQHALCH